MRQQVGEPNCSQNTIFFLRIRNNAGYGIAIAVQRAAADVLVVPAFYVGDSSRLSIHALETAAPFAAINTDIDPIPVAWERDANLDARKELSLQTDRTP